MPEEKDPKGSDDFEAGLTEARTGLVAEFWDFLRHNKKWWLAPILISIVVLGVLVLLGGSGAAPFVYTLF